VYIPAFRDLKIQDDAVGILIVGDIAVIAELVLLIQKDQNAAGDSDGKPQQNEKRIPFITGHVPQGCFEIVSKHCIYRKFLFEPAINFSPIFIISTR
jgi:hypothetical protein